MTTDNAHWVQLESVGRNMTKEQEIIHAYETGWEDGGRWTIRKLKALLEGIDAEMEKRLASKAGNTK